MGAVSFSQTVIIDRPQTSNGLISSYWDNDEAGVYSADYFVLENAVQVSSITFYGFTVLNDMQLPLDGLALDFNLFIFNNDGGIPQGNPEDAGTAVLALANVDLAHVEIDGGAMGMSSNLTIDVTAANGGQEVVLPAGEYWVSAFPTIEMSDPMWYWLGSTVNLPYPSVLIDPDDLFGDGMTDWTEISTLIDEDFPSFSWTMMGEEMLSTENNVLAGVSIYPNPSTDVLNISAPANVDVESVTLYDVLGKSVNADFNNGTVNISALANGIYVLQVKTSEGILTQKVVKN